MTRPIEVRNGVKLNVYLSQQTKRRAYQMATQLEISVSRLVAKLVEQQFKEMNREK
jgi:hypothetical protein